VTIKKARRPRSAVAGFATAATSAIVRFGAGTPRRRGQLGVCLTTDVASSVNAHAIPNHGVFTTSLLWKEAGNRRENFNTL
jgi:hypothetical protein